VCVCVCYTYALCIMHRTHPSEYSHLTFPYTIYHIHLSVSVRKALQGQWEVRPNVRVVFWLQGSVLSLGLSSTDLYATPAASASAAGGGLGGVGGGGAGVGVGGVGEGEDIGVEAGVRDVFAGESVHVWSPSAKDPLWEKE
jgi:hypothetical protein